MASLFEKFAEATIWLSARLKRALRRSYLNLFFLFYPHDRLNFEASYEVNGNLRKSENKVLCWHLTGKFSLSCTLLISAWSEFCRLSSRGHLGHWGVLITAITQKKSANTATFQKKIEWSVLPNSYYPYRLHVGVPPPPRDSKGKLCIQTKWPIKGWRFTWFLCIEKLKEYFYSSLDGMLGTYLYSSAASRVGTARVGSCILKASVDWVSVDTISRYGDWHSADISTDTQSICRPRLGRMLVDMLF